MLYLSLFRKETNMWNAFNGKCDNRSQDFNERFEGKTLSFSSNFLQKEIFAETNLYVGVSIKWKLIKWHACYQQQILLASVFICFNER